MKWHLCILYTFYTHTAVWTEYPTKREACRAWLNACKKFAHRADVQVSLHKL